MTHAISNYSTDDGSGGTLVRPHLIAVTVLGLAHFSSGAFACVMAPPAGPEEVAARTLRYQADLWRRSQSVFIVRTERPGRVRNGGSRAVLVPVLQLKGPSTTDALRVAHTHWTSCGPAPFLDALNGQADEFFVAYSAAVVPDGASILATLRPMELIEPQAYEAWQAAYAGR